MTGWGRWWPLTLSGFRCCFRVPRVMCSTVPLRSASEAKPAPVIFSSRKGPEQTTEKITEPRETWYILFSTKKTKTKKGVSVLINVVLTLKKKKKKKKKKKHGSQTLWACWYTKLINRFNLVCSRDKEKLRQKQIFSRKYITCKKRKKEKKDEAQTCW